METDKLYFKRLDTKAILPTRGSSSSAGLDLYCIEELSIPSHGRVLARTGLAVAIPKNHYGRIAPRSGLAVKLGLDVLAGVIDSDYRGELLCALYNTSSEVINLDAGSKICQIIVEKISTLAAAWAEALPETTRGSAGFGSTG